MKSVYKTVGNYLIMVFLVFAVFLGLVIFTSKKTTDSTKTVVVTRTVVVPGDSIPYQVAVSVPTPRDTIRDTTWLYKTVDTSKILRDYFASFTYRDTIRDTSFIAILQEVVSKNRIIDRKFALQNLRPQTINYNTTIFPVPGKWYAGVAVNYGGNFGIGGQLLYVKNNNAFGVTCDAINRNVGFTYLHSIK